MQSVFKLPLAVAILHLVEKGKFSLDRQVRFAPEDRIPHAYSPLQDEYPEAGVDIPLRELLRLTVSLSDNVAADIMLGLAGGPEAVDTYIAQLGIPGFHLQDGERALHHQTALQYRNWFEPAGAVQLLRRIADASPLTPEDTKLLLGWMHSTRANRLSADLPEGTLVAHKSGSSDVDAGLAHATNDIGLITLPDGSQLAIAVFVTDSTADQAAREKAIARIARAAYDAATHARGHSLLMKDQNSPTGKINPQRAIRDLQLGSIISNGSDSAVNRGLRVENLHPCTRFTSHVDAVIAGPPL